MSVSANRVVRTLACLPLVVACLASPTPAAGPEQVDASVQNRKLGRGVNIIGYDPIWRSFEQARLGARHFRLIKEGGFDTVRINLHPFRHMAPAGEHALSSSWLKVLDWAVEQALKNDLMVILDLHEYNAMGKDPQGNRAKFLAFWSQIAPRYRHASSTTSTTTVGSGPSTMP